MKMKISQTSIGSFAIKIIILFLGLLFLLPSAYKLYAYCAFRFHAISVEGIILDASSGRDLGSRPFVEYKDWLGNSYERKSRAKTHWFFAAKSGEKIKVFYKRHNPTVAIVDSKFHYIILPCVFIAIGACFLFCFIRDILSEKKNPDQGPEESTHPVNL